MVLRRGPCQNGKRPTADGTGVDDRCSGLRRANAITQGPDLIISPLRAAEYVGALAKTYA